MKALKKIFNYQNTDPKSLLIPLIPDDIWLNIFYYLLLQDLLSAAKVSKDWNRIIMKPMKGKEVSLFTMIDNLTAQPWIQKIKLELTEFTPTYSYHQTLQYTNFYKRMIKKKPPSTSIPEFLNSDISDGFDYLNFSKQLEFYIDHGLDVKLLKMIENHNNSFLLDQYMGHRPNINKIFNSNNTNCFNIILSFLTRKVKGILLLIAVEMRREKFVEELLKFDVDLTVRNVDGDSLTALALAYKKGDINILTILCKKIYTQDAKQLNPLDQNFREEFYRRYGISYQLYLKCVLHEEQENELFEIQHKVDFIIHELFNNTDPKLVTLFHSIIEKNDDNLLEKLNRVLDEHQTMRTSNKKSP